MNIKIVIIRRYSQEQKKTIQPMLSELFNLVFEYGGYVSGETLVNRDDPEEHLIIAIWNSADQWQRYHEADRVRELCSFIDAVIGKTTAHRIYQTESGQSGFTLDSGKVSGRYHRDVFYNS